MATTSERGLGAPHVADLKRLKAALRDGDPCWRCGQPMYRQQNLDRDHVIDRAHGGTDGPAVLAHASCNRRAGARAGNLGRPYTISVASAPPATCKTCGRQYRYAARNCEMCGTHYHPSYGQQRTCSRACGTELRRKAGNLGAGGRVQRLPRPLCKTCGKPCRSLKSTYCSNVCTGEASRDLNQTWPSSRLQHYTCRYCGMPAVVKATPQPREVCAARECQMARRAANNLRVRNGLTKEEADARVRAVVLAAMQPRGRSPAT